MSRFGNLEFEGDLEGQLQSSTGHSSKDGAFYMAEAQSAFESGDFEKGLRLYSKVLEFNPDEVGAWTGQVRMLLELGENQEAKLWADKALERFPNDAELLAAKAVTLARGGDLHGALVFSDASIQERGDTPYIWLARADVLLARKETRADYCFEKALLLAPKSWFIHWLAGRIRYHYEQFALAFKLIQRALEWNAGHFLLWLEMGRCQCALGMIGSAKVSFSQAQQLNPHNPDVRLALSEMSNHGMWSRLRGWWRQYFH